MSSDSLSSCATSQRKRADRGDVIIRACLETLEARRLLSFSPAVSYAAGTAPRQVVTADFNGDGRLDLAVANPSSNSISVLLGNGNGTFQAPRSSAAGDNPFSLAVGDLNADGKLDLAAGSSGGVNVMLGNGDGTFRAPSHIAVGYSDTRSVATGDFNNDGKMDLVVTSNYWPDPYWYPQGRADVLLAVGDGSFAHRGYWAPWDRALGDAVVADMNGDGKLDLVTELADYTSIIVLRGDGQGNIGNHANAGAIAVIANNPSAAGDFNGDGKLDLVTSWGTFFGNGTGGFVSDTPQSNAAGTGPGSVALGDFDRDGKLDIARGDGIIRNAGDGTFATVEAFPGGAGGSMVAAGDFNGDGWLDVAIPKPGETSVSVLINDRSWSPAPPTVSVNDVTVTEGNTGTVNATFTVTLSQPSAVPVTVQYSTSDFGFASAVAGSDYIAASGTVTIPAGQTSGTFSVVVIGDRVFESTEQFAVTLSAPTNATLADATGIGTILDDEPRISINNVSNSEGNGKKGTSFTFTVKLSAAYDQAVTVNYATANGTATAGSDYQAKSGSVTFAPGETVKTITVTVLGDKVREANETFFVDLFAPGSNALISAARGTGTIWNDDR